MAYQVNIKATYSWVGDGVGPLTNPGAQSFPIFSGQVAVPGGDAPSLANLETALTNAVTAAETQLTTALVAQIQGWATGGG